MAPRRNTKNFQYEFQYVFVNRCILLTRVSSNLHLYRAYQYISIFILHLFAGTYSQALGKYTATHPASSALHPSDRSFEELPACYA